MSDQIKMPATKNCVVARGKTAQENPPARGGQYKHVHNVANNLQIETKTMILKSMPSVSG